MTRLSLKPLSLKPSVVLLNVALIVVTLAFLFPLFWAISLSFMTADETIALPPVWISARPILDNYLTILSGQDTPVLLWFSNSLVAALAYATLGVFVAVPAAYALSRFRFPLGKAYFRLILASMTIPGIMLFIPNYNTVSGMGFTDSLWAIILPGLGGTFGVFLLRQVFLGIPRDLEEAAEIDGAGPVMRLRLVILPLARESIITLWVMNFLANWNDYFWPLVVLYSPPLRTMPVGMATLNGPYVALYGPLMAGAILMAVPSIVIFLIVQRYYLRGISLSGALKE